MSITNLIEKEFNKNPTLMTLLKKWHKDSALKENDLYHLKSLYKNNIEYIRNFKMSIKQFESFSEFYTALIRINKKTKKLINHPFFYMDDKCFIRFLENKKTEYSIIDPNNILVVIDSFIKTKEIAPIDWCLSNSEKQFNNYTKASGKLFIVFNRKNMSITGTTVNHEVNSFNENNIEVETPKVLLKIIKPIVYKNYIKNIFKYPLTASLILTVFMIFLFSNLSIYFNLETLTYKHFYLFSFSFLGITLSFSLIMTPPNLTRKTRDFFVFFGFLITSFIIGVSIFELTEINKTFIEKQEQTFLL